MKKPTDETTRRRKLVVNREVITTLTESQLKKVGGGWTAESSCDYSQQKLCVENPI